MLDQLTSRKTLWEAFRRVRENGGCRGADGVTVSRFAANLQRELDSLQDRLLHRGYHPFPLLRIEIPKPVSGVRHLSIPTVRDRVVQTAVYQITREVFEAEFEECSHAFRLGRSVKTAVHQIQELRNQGFHWVVDADIDGFFDSIPHDPLLEQLSHLPLDPYICHLFEHWIRAEVYDGKRLFTLTQGIPQGSVTSPMLANLFLDALDETLAALGQTVVRYADDFLILCKDPSHTSEALELTDDVLERLGLELNRDKTLVTSFDQGFKFLGATFLRDGIYLPFDRPKAEREPPSLPPPLDLLTYLELREQADPWQPST